MMEERNTVNSATMPSNAALRHSAREILKGRWIYPVLCTLLYAALTAAASFIPFAGLLFVCPFAFGYSLTFLHIVRGEVEDEDIVTKPFAVFQHYGRYLCVSLLVMVFTLLWSLLLVVPGIVKAYAYALTPYVAHDNPGMSPMECLRQSQKMMHGYKMKLFLLDLSFIGWVLLCIVTMGIGCLWLYPYMQTTHSKFYEELKNRREQ